MLTVPVLVADTLIMIGIFSFLGLFFGLALLRLFVPESHWINTVLHRIEGHLDFGGQAHGSGGSERSDCAPDGGDGD